jgi:tRNA uridine 5-carboxymethylaminomethyl modification enzyme
MERIQNAISEIQQKTVSANAVNQYLQAKNSTPITQSVKLDALLRRPQVELNEILKVLGMNLDLRGEESAEVSHRIKYEQYILRQEQQNAHYEHLEHIRLPQGIEYAKIHGLSSEATEKLGKLLPENLSQAARISGVSPADISILMTWLKAGGYNAG